MKLQLLDASLYLGGFNGRQHDLYLRLTQSYIPSAIVRFVTVEKY